MEGPLAMAPLPGPRVAWEGPWRDPALTMTRGSSFSSNPVPRAFAVGVQLPVMNALRQPAGPVAAARRRRGMVRCATRQ